MTQATITKREHEFFDAVYDMMQSSYPEMADRFGIWRIHNHFDISEEEVFHETSNAETKESILKIIKKSDLPNSAFASTWKLTAKGPIVGTWCCDDSPPIVPKP